MTGASKSEQLSRFTLSNGHTYSARQCVDGVLVDPKLPARFDDTPNEARPPGHTKFWSLPFIVTFDVSQWDAHYAERADEYAEKAKQDWSSEGRVNWMKAFPSGTRYTTRCLDGGAWDRSTNWGSFATLEEAVQCAKGGDPYHFVAHGR